MAQSSEIMLLVEILAVAMTATIIAAVAWAAWIIRRWLGGLKAAVSEFGHQVVERTDETAREIVEQINKRNDLIEQAFRFGVQYGRVADDDTLS